MSMDTERILQEHGARLRPKQGSRWMAFLGFLVRVVTFGRNKRFVSHYWTTMGRTIWYPEAVTNPFLKAYLPVIKHECVHVSQWRRWSILFSLSYLFFPVPILLAWFRWRWEREAYLVNLADAVNKEAAINHYVDVLWREYAWTWPKSRMRKWFQERV